MLFGFVKSIIENMKNPAALTFSTKKAGDYEMNKKFWMVYVEGRNGPTHKHPTKASASAEAMRLHASTGCVAYVLSAVEAVKPIVPRYEVVKLK